MHLYALIESLAKIYKLILKCAALAITLQHKYPDMTECNTHHILILGVFFRICLL